MWGEVGQAIRLPTWMHANQIVPILFLLVILSLLSQNAQSTLREHLGRRPLLLFAAPALLSAVFLLILRQQSILSTPIAALILCYTFLPCAIAFAQRSSQPAWRDLATIAMLWLPLEFGAGATWIPKQAQGFAHTVAYGVSITLALWIFLLYRRFGGMKYKLPGGLKDFLYPLVAFVLVAPVLILLGWAVSFLAPFHWPPHLPSAGLGAKFVLILFATALPEEILFRGLIQNLLLQKLGARTATLLLAAVIFGSAHLNNAPGPLPNWRYMLLATIAGFAYGKVFHKANSIFASTFLHALVNTVRHTFF